MPEQLPDYWHEEINATISTIKNNIGAIYANTPYALPRTSSFFFITDTHWRGNNQKSPQIALELANAIDADAEIPASFKTRINYNHYRKVIFAGDSVKGNAGDKDGIRAEAGAFLNAWDVSFHLATALGNHDTNREGSNAIENRLSNSEMYDLFLARESDYVTRTNNDVNIGYFDDTINKIRYFMFKHYDSPTLSSSTWTKFVNAIDEIKENGWGAIFFCHTFWGLTESETLPGTINIPSGSISFASSLTDICNEKMVVPIALMVGHIHTDNSYLLTTTAGNKLLITSTVCDWYAGEKGPTSLLPAPVMTLGNATEQAFEFVQIDMNGYKLYLNRVGAGEDRVFDIPVPGFAQSPVLFIGAGTSSMQGYTEIVETGAISVSNAWYWDYYNNEWKTPVRDPTGVSNQRGSLVPAFFQRLRQYYPFRPLLFINAGKGGSVISKDLLSVSSGNWSTDGTLLNRLDTMVADALTAWDGSVVTFGGILWYGGGNDAGSIVNESTTIEVFKTSFREIVEYLHDTYSTSFFLIGNTPSPTSSEERKEAVHQIRNAEEEVVNEFYWARKVADAIEYEDKPEYWTGYEGTHLGQVAINDIGTTAASSILFNYYTGENMGVKFINLENLTDFWTNAKTYIDGTDVTKVSLNNSETIGGIKTFSSVINGTIQKAMYDAEGNSINSTYATKDTATTTDAGLMSAADKVKLDGISSSLTFKGSVADSSSFPASDNAAGDVYMTEDDSHFYAYNGSTWTDLGTLSSFVPMTNSEVDALFA